MSDSGQAREGPEPVKRGLWSRYRHAGATAKVGLPAVVVAVIVAVVAIVAGGDSTDETATDATTSPATADSEGPHNPTAALLLVATAARLAEDVSTPDTTTPMADVDDTPETTSTPEETPLTAAGPDTTPATTAPSTTAPAPTSAPSPPSSTAAPQPTSPTLTASTSTASATTSTTMVPPRLPAGQVAPSPDAFRVAWNAAARGTPVAAISTWTEQPVAGYTASVADLGGNLRVVLASPAPTSPVAEAVLAWIPLTGDSGQAEANQAYQHAFAVLTEAVDPTITADEQTALAADLGIDAISPPFPKGTAMSATAAGQGYELQAVAPAPGPGVYTLIGVTELV